MTESPVPKRAWGAPLARLDVAWTKLEARLCAFVLFAEIFALCVWISLKGLSGESQGEDKMGVVFRILITSTAFGFVAHKLTKTRKEKWQHRASVCLALVLGSLVGRLRGDVGVSYFSNVLNWMQTASLLTLAGGLRGLATRLTLWVALLGASIA